MCRNQFTCLHKSILRRLIGLTLIAEVKKGPFLTMGKSLPYCLLFFSLWESLRYFDFFVHTISKIPFDSGGQGDIKHLWWLCYIFIPTHVLLIALKVIAMNSPFNIEPTMRIFTTQFQHSRHPSRTKL